VVLKNDKAEFFAGKPFSQLFSPLTNVNIGWQACTTLRNVHSSLTYKLSTITEPLVITMIFLEIYVHTNATPQEPKLGLAGRRGSL
jgi:hypothetical protein